MGWDVSKHSQPHGKLGLYDRRLVRLRGVVKRGESEAHVVAASEKLRFAALAVIKARRALIKEYPKRDSEGLESRKLQEEEERWLSLSVKEIVEAYGASVT